MAKDAIKMTGKVIQAHNSSEYEILLENNAKIQAHISGKMKMYHIKIIPGDSVDVEISPYDWTKGRIVYRHK
ncbi:translation initiation factor IF-1 [Mycoplasma sp. 480]|uniref:translation initiation factor IF-1 n=1 Tax=Mycoplasma sp. 480 TaxID=3440155 RepID=UPI003F50D71E